MNDEPLRNSEILEILQQLSPRWQCFDSESQNRRKIDVMQKLVTSGFAKSKIAIRIVNRNTGDWKLLRYIVSGEWIKAGAVKGSLAGPIFNYISQSCDPTWFPIEGRAISAASGIDIHTEHDWTLAITEAAEKRWPASVEAIGEYVRNHCAPADIRRDGNPATGRDATLQTLRTPQSVADIYSPWIGSPEFIPVMKMNGIRGVGDTNIRRKKKEWGAESQEGSNHQIFRFHLQKLNNLGISYPAEWNKG